MLKRDQTSVLPGSPAEKAFRALIRTCGLVGRVMQPYFNQFGISGSQWGVLVTLYRAESESLPALRQTDLSDRLLIRPPSVTGVVDRLERMGLVARDHADGDRRVRQIRLTPEGRQLVARILRRHPAHIEAVLSGLDHDAQVQLHGLIERLATHLESMLDAQASSQVQARTSGAISSGRNHEKRS